MKTIEDFFDEKSIINYLCKIRVKIAKQRNKKHLIHVLTSNPKFNYHKSPLNQSQFDKELFDTLNQIFPPRHKWKKLGPENRIKKNKEGAVIKLNSVDKNFSSLTKTVAYYRKKHKKDSSVILLNKFIRDIKSDIINKHIKISKPYILASPKDKKQVHKLKNGEKNICRPLSLFNLKDRLVLSFTNRYLTNLFDKYFEDCSLAFRSNSEINHHLAITKILDYKSKHKDIPLWVAECDMQKFYDSVDHKLIKKQFDTLISKSEKDNPTIDFSLCKQIFYSYLDCYCFNVDVLPLNSDSSYWTKSKINEGCFGWIEDVIEEKKFYSNINYERIGVPQGGALSGLIANIVLDIVDKAIYDKYKDVFYTRFCDDMVIMHPDEEVCKNSIELYKKTLEDCNLAPHNFQENLRDKRKVNNKKKHQSTISLKSFWKGKSKGPYKWDNFINNGYPWIGFVGYEMHFDGSVRVRKSSLRKEINKQKDVVKRIKDAIRSQPRKSALSVKESMMKRLVGMSVSRIELWNYRNVIHEMCWKNGFQEITVNTSAIKQIKALDRNRNKLYYSLMKECKGLDLPKNDNTKESKKRQFVEYNSAYSYYYHVIIRAKINTLKGA